MPSQKGDSKSPFLLPLKIIPTLDSVCFVLKSPQPNLTNTQRHSVSHTSSLRGLKFQTLIAPGPASENSPDQRHWDKEGAEAGLALLLLCLVLLTGWSPWTTSPSASLQSWGITEVQGQGGTAAGRVATTGAKEAKGHFQSQRTQDCCRVGTWI